MLQFIQIHNLALLDHVCLEFNPGFTAVTGETGAGKSVLLGALALLSGARTDKTIIKQDQDACHVEASIFFENPSKINTLLDSLSLPACEEGCLLIKRSLHRSKPPRISINGSITSLSTLASLGEYWIDFHGPGEPQKLFKPLYQLQMLDLYAGISPLLKDYSDLYSQWKSLLNKIQEIRSNGQLSNDEITFIQSQLDKINALKPSPDVIQNLESSYQRLNSAQEIAQLSSKIYAGISNPSSGIISNLQDLWKHSQDLASFDPESEPIQERINSLIIEAEDLASEIRSNSSNIEASPSAIEKIKEKINLWLDIKRQYGPTVEEVVKKRDSLQEKLNSQSNIESTIAKIESEANLRKKDLLKIADQLTEKRSQSAKELSSKTQKLLKTLGFQKAQFQIKICKSPELTPQGNSYAEFLFTANPGQDLMPLNKIASSGETARVMLALKAILAEVDQTPLLVFDEVDANVGGEIGAKVATEMAKLAKKHQVFCVTHLPQVASKAHNHLLVNKLQLQDSTTVSIKQITHPTQRTTEIARMLGDRNSNSALNHAKELLALL